MDDNEKNFIYDVHNFDEVVIVIFNLLVLGIQIINLGKSKKKFQLRFIKYEDLIDQTYTSFS